MPSPPADTRSASRLLLLGRVLCGCCLAYNVAVAAIGWNNSILDTMAFRQAQTALSCRFMLGHHYRVLYETPVFGPPWSIPFEFPLYQWIVSFLTTTTGCPLDQAGRLVNRGFFLLCLVPSYCLLRLLGLSPWLRYVTLSLLLVSPFYLFWTRTFLMESTALFLALSYLACGVAHAQEPRVATGIGALLFGILAALVKVTTFAGPLLLVGFLVAWLGVRYRQGFVTGRQLAWRGGTLVLLMLIPTTFAFGWTHVADGQKSQHPLAEKLTSANLHEWNFGKPYDRYQPETWGTLFGRAPLVLTPWTPGVAELMYGSPWLLLLATVPGLLVARQKAVLVLCCLAVYFALPFVFTNLHVFHEYYACATNVYLIAAVGIGLAALHDRGGNWRVVGYGLLLAVLVLAPVGYFTTYVPLQRTDEQESRAACAAVRANTEPADVIVVLGCDWSSEVPYGCERRALMIPTWNSVNWNDFDQYVALLDDYRIGAFVVNHHSPSGERIVSPRAQTIVEETLRGHGYTLRSCHEDATFTVYSARR